jgi:hypothetical protein
MGTATLASGGILVNNFKISILDGDTIRQVSNYLFEERGVDQHATSPRSGYTSVVDM